MTDSDEDSERLRKLVDDEYFDLKLYELILKDIKDKKEKRIVERLYEKERKDLETLLRFSEGYRPRLNPIKLYFYYLLYKIFGLTFVVKFAESNEGEVVEGYQDLLRKEGKRENRARLKQLIRSTKRYEYMLRSWIKDERLKYLSFIALGITDAIISLVGTQAGFLGATEDGTYVALSTFIVGLATGISMGAATYLQAKEMKNGVKPFKAALSSVKTYGVVTLLLMLPFLIIKNPYMAFILSFIASLLILALFTYYTSVVNDRNFWKQLKENLLITMFALFVGFVLGKGASLFLEDLA